MIGSIHPGFTGFRAQQKDMVKNKVYKVIATRYDGYGQNACVYIEESTGELKVVVWQDDLQFKKMSCQHDNGS